MILRTYKNKKWPQLSVKGKRKRLLIARTKNRNTMQKECATIAIICTVETVWPTSAHTPIGITMPRECARAVTLTSTTQQSERSNPKIL